MLREEILQKIESAGIVGAGGAGFPTHVKAKADADVVIANCAECEPMLKVDKNLMETFPDKIVGGVSALMEATGAKKGYIAVKSKNHKACEVMEKAVKRKADIEVFQLDNYYPAGDEQQIVYGITGNVVPVGGIPLDVGAVVCNASTLYNISEALEDRPVTEKFVTVNGDVVNPVTLRVPVGMPVSALIKAAGGTLRGGLDGYSLITGGPMMGAVSKDFESPVTKTTSGVIVLDDAHKLIRKKTSSLDVEHKIAKAACCQFNLCSYMCPRNLLGLNVQPHLVMRATAYGNKDAAGKGDITFGCCDCGLCTHFACPMGLSPGRFISRVKAELLAKGIKPEKIHSKGVSDTRSLTRTPTKRLVERLGLSAYQSEAPLDISPLNADSVRIMLKQHIGAPSEPVVKKGDRVEKGAVIARTPQGKLGAFMHASISGHVSDVTDSYIEIKA